MGEKRDKNDSSKTFSAIVKAEIVKDFVTEYGMSLAKAKYITSDDLVHSVTGQMWEAQERAIMTIGNTYLNKKEK